MTSVDSDTSQDIIKLTVLQGYVEMTSVDSDTSQDIAEAISLKGGRYLEAQV